MIDHESKEKLKAQMLVVLNTLEEILDEAVVDLEIFGGHALAITTLVKLISDLEVQPVATRQI